MFTIYSKHYHVKPLFLAVVGLAHLLLRLTYIGPLQQCNRTRFKSLDDERLGSLHDTFLVSKLSRKRSWPDWGL